MSESSIAELNNVELLGRIHGAESEILTGLIFEIDTDMGVLYGAAGSEKHLHMGYDSVELEYETSHGQLASEMIGSGVRYLMHNKEDAVNESIGNQYSSIFDDDWLMVTLGTADIMNSVMAEVYDRPAEAGYPNFKEIAEFASNYGSTPANIMLEELQDGNICIGEYSSLSNGQTEVENYGFPTWVHDMETHMHTYLAFGPRIMDYFASYANKISLGGVRADANVFMGAMEEISNSVEGIYASQADAEPKDFVKYLDNIQNSWIGTTDGARPFSNSESFEVPEWFGRYYLEQAEELYSTAAQLPPLLPRARLLDEIVKFIE